MSKRANFFAIGLFVLIAAALAGATVLVFGSGALRKDTITLLATFRGEANGLRPGSPVKAYGVEIGTVTQIMLHTVEASNEIVIPVLFEIDRNRVAALMGEAHQRVDSDAAFQAMRARGLHATLQTQSLVTGMLYIDLAYGMEGEGYTLTSNRFAGYFSVPTVPTNLELMMRAMDSLVENLGKTDIRGLVSEAKAVMEEIRDDLKDIDFAQIGEDVNGLISELRSTLNSEEAEAIGRDFAEALANISDLSGLLKERSGPTFDRIDASLAQIEDTAQDANVWLDPDSAAYLDLVDTLERIAESARSLRDFIDYLERNPNALITGRSTEEP